MRAINSSIITTQPCLAFGFALFSSNIYCKSHLVKIKEHIRLKSPVAATSPRSVFWFKFRNQPYGKDHGKENRFKNTKITYTLPRGSVIRNLLVSLFWKILYGQDRGLSKFIVSQTTTAESRVSLTHLGQTCLFPQKLYEWPQVSALCRRLRGGNFIRNKSTHSATMYGQTCGDWFLFSKFGNRLIIHSWKLEQYILPQCEHVNATIYGDYRKCWRSCNYGLFKWGYVLSMQNAVEECLCEIF